MTAVASGTATDFLDLYTKLRDFLTSNADLVSASEEWTLVDGNSGTLTTTDNLVFSGPGLGGTDEILVSLEPNVNAGAGYHNLGVRGLTAYNDAEPLSSQVNNSGVKYIHLWDSSMPYWFIANGRRFIVVARPSTVYQAMYAGFALPFHLPTTYPYPLFVGGCSSNATWAYSKASGDHSMFFNPGTVCSAICSPELTWFPLCNQREDPVSAGGDFYSDLAHPNRIAPWAAAHRLSDLRDRIDGGYQLEHSYITCSEGYNATLAELDGVFKVSGFSNSSESIITIGSTDYLVVQNVYRTSNEHYAAIALE